MGGTGRMEREWMERKTWDGKGKYEKEGEG